MLQFSNGAKSFWEYYACFVFAHKTIGEHGSPLQYNNCFARFIKYVFTYNFCDYLRENEVLPYDCFVFVKPKQLYKCGVQHRYLNYSLFTIQYSLNKIKMPDCCIGHFVCDYMILIIYPYLKAYGRFQALNRLLFQTFRGGVQP